MSTLKEHERSHTGDKPFSCDKCPTRFVRKNDQVRHRNTKHKDEKEHACQGVLRSGIAWGCGARFARADALKEHWNKGKLACKEPYLAELSSPMDDSVDLLCDICMKKSKGHSKFRAHLELHIQDCDDPPYPCDCGVSFAFADVRDEHAALFIPPTCGFQANGPHGLTAGRKSRKMHPDWGCGSRYLSHKDLAIHIKTGECGNQLREAELREAESLRKIVKEDLEMESKVLHQLSWPPVPGQIPTAQHEQDRNAIIARYALKHSRAYEELASVNRVRVEQLEREPYHEQMCLLHESYITRFGNSRAPDMLSSRNSPPAGKKIRRTAKWGVLDGSTLIYVQLSLEDDKSRGEDMPNRDDRS